MDRFETRRSNLRKLLKKAGVDAMLVSNYTNVTYLTGFTGDDSYLLVTPKKEIVISDSRYTTQLEQECPGLEVHIRANTTPILDASVEVMRAAKVSSLAIEGDAMTVAAYENLSEKSPSTALGITSGLVEQLRAIKDKIEIDEIRLAARQAEKAFTVLRASLRPEMTEKEAADLLEHQMRLFGAKCAAFPSIIGVGPNAALPHYRPGQAKIGDDDFVLVDWGATARHYRSDLTRVLVTGKISPKLERVYGVVLTAQQQAIAAIRPGITGREVDQVARGIIADAGFGKHFGHGLGHGVGLDIHEAPRMNATCDRPLEVGMVVTVEPGIYLPGWGGVRIEDDVLVTKTGHEVLTNMPKQLAEMVCS
jgi:Xaa-Pro aminopeptidase